MRMDLRMAPPADAGGCCGCPANAGRTRPAPAAPATSSFRNVRRFFMRSAPGRYTTWIRDPLHVLELIMTSRKTEVSRRRFIETVAAAGAAAVSAGPGVPAARAQTPGSAPRLKAKAPDGKLLKAGLI